MSRRKSRVYAMLYTRKTHGWLYGTLWQSYRPGGTIQVSQRRRYVTARMGGKAPLMWGDELRRRLLQPRCIEQP